jgi:hypothetical protein
MTLIDPVGKTRSICFKTADVALKYVDYTSNFRAKNGLWPNLDMTQEIKVVKPKKIKTRVPADVARFMEVVCLNREELDDLGRINGLSFFYVLDFETKGFAIELKGQEIDGFPDPKDFVNNLEILIR